MKLLIVGRTGSGKDTLQNFLCKTYGWIPVVSYSTRERRPGEGNTHNFITKEEAAAVPDSDKVAVTRIKNATNEENEYFATRQQVENCDCYIIDPKGVKVLFENMPDEVFEICYIQAESKEKQKEMAVLRANGDANAETIFENRYASEDAQFTAFEKEIEEMKNSYRYSVFTFTNTYNEDDLQTLALRLNQRKHTYESMRHIIKDLKQSGLIHVNKDNNIVIEFRKNENDETGKETVITDERFIQILLKKNDDLAACISMWLGLPTTELHAFTTPKTERELSLEEKVKDIVTNLCQDKPNVDVDSITSDICNELETSDEFHELIDNYLYYMVLSRIND